MARVREYLEVSEQIELARMFYHYPAEKLVEYVQDEDSYIEEKHMDYLPYLESVLYSSLYKAIDNYNKGSEYSLRRRPAYFKSYLDKTMKEDIKEETLNINAAISRVEGTASRKPLKSDKEFYKLLQDIKDGKTLLEMKLKEAE